MVKTKVQIPLTMKMKAMQFSKFGGPEVLEMTEVPVPKCGENEVLIRVHAAGVNPVDVLLRAGFFGPQPFPYTPGLDASGIVHSVGEKVTKVKANDRVFCSMRRVTGGYAEFAVFKEDGVFPLDDRLSFDQGAAIGVPYFTAYRALIHKAKARPAEWVLIHGASGAVGVAAVQMASALGMTILGTAGTSDGMEIVKRAGAKHVFNHRHPDYTKQIQEVTRGKGVDIVLEMLANVNLEKDIQLVKAKGRIIVIGSRGKAELTPALMLATECSITGLTLYAADESEWEEAGAAILAGISRGWLDPVIDKTYSLQDAGRAHVDIMDGSGARGKLVLTVPQATVQSITAGIEIKIQCTDI